MTWFTNRSTQNPIRDLKRGINMRDVRKEVRLAIRYTESPGRECKQESVVYEKLENVVCPSFKYSWVDENRMMFLICNTSVTHVTPVMGTGRHLAAHLVMIIRR
jgi:hypothetical protein